MTVSGAVSSVRDPGSPERPAATLNRRYLAAFLAVACLIVLDQILMAPELTELASYAPIVNLVSRQRGLSLQLVTQSLLLERIADSPERERHREALSEFLQIWIRTHEILVAESAPFPEGFRHPAPARQILGQASPYVHSIRNHVTRLLELTESGRMPQPLELRREVERIVADGPQFVAQINRLLEIYEHEADRRVQLIRRTNWAVAAGVLATMWILQILAIRPATQVLEQRYSETADQYRTVIESINEGLMRLDRQGRILFANNQMGELSGREPQQLTGMVAATLFRAPRLVLWPPIDPALDTRLPQEMELIRRDGSTRTCLVSPCRLQQDRKETSGWVILVIDVTQQRAAERKAQSLADQLAHADRLKSMGEIAAGLAHEVNQPLGAIANFAEGSLARLSNGPCPSEDLVPPLKRILAAALRAGGIIRRVKQFSQRRPHSLAPAELNSLVRETVELFAMELQRKQVASQLDLAATDLPLECDALQLSQVLANLLQNSLQALDANPIENRRIDIATRVDQNDWLSLTIRDNGPGIPESILSRLFEPFSTSRPDGLGMGLSIVRSIIEAHGGTITASNGPEGGAVMSIALPCGPNARREGLPTGLPPLKV